VPQRRVGIPGLPGQQGPAEALGQVRGDPGDDAAVARITRANMESYADTLGPTDIACLTEPRIVDALFEGVSGYLIAHDEPAKPLGIRLQGRTARFATYATDTIQQLEDDAVIALWPGSTDDAATGFTVSRAG
jgi:hypothetical protein